MKKSLIMLCVLGASLSASWETDLLKEQKTLSKAYSENVRMCKICIVKATRYKEDMRKDNMAKATLENYIRKVKLYCGPIIASSKNANIE